MSPSKECAAYPDAIIAVGIGLTLCDDGVFLPPLERRKP